MIPFTVNPSYAQNASMPMNHPYQPGNMIFDMQSANIQMLEEEIKRQKDLQFQQEKNWIENQKILYKECYLNEERMDLAKRKLQLNEYAKEARKANYDQLIIGADGELTIQPHNLLIDFPQRKVANFIFEKIYKLKSSNGDEGFYLLILSVNSIKKEIFLDARKAVKNNYLLEKITEADGEIFANNPRERQNILRGFWIKALSLCKKEKKYPANNGWIRDEKEKYKFITEGSSLLWEQVMKKSK